MDDMYIWVTSLPGSTVAGKLQLVFIELHGYQGYCQGLITPRSESRLLMIQERDI